MKKQFRSFKDARRYAHSLKFRNVDEWRKFSKSGKKPNDIPSGVDDHYKKEWVSWGDWLGTNSISTQKIQFLSFTEARKFVHNQKFSGQKQWRDFIRSGKKPIDVPSNPNIVYKNEWKGYPDWFGKSFLSYDDAKKYCQNLGLKSITEWIKFKNSGKKPKNIPSNPPDYYKNEFRGWGEFLGTGRIANQNREFLSYDEAKKKLQQINISTQKIYRNFVRQGKLPSGIPRDPQHIYKNKGWKGWGKFLETGRIANQNREFLSYENAKEQVRKLGITTLTSWQKAVSEKSIPKNIPTLPPRTYKKEWISWGDFLGTGNKNPRDIDYLPFNEAKKEYQKITKENNIQTLEQWKQFLKTHKLPQNLPRHPEWVYSKKRIENK